MRETIKQVAPHSYRVNFFKQTTGRIDSYFVTVDENGVIISSNPPLP
jgi:hypothetical protein